MYFKCKRCFLKTKRKGKGKLCSRRTDQRGATKVRETGKTATARETKTTNKKQARNYVFSIFKLVTNYGVLLFYLTASVV
jgi:hypothetical protein